MVTEKRLEKAKFHIDSINKLIKMDADGAPINSLKIEYHTEDCLTAIRSVSDYILEDYNKEFGLGLPLNDLRFKENFEQQANITNNARAISFVNDYNSKFRILYRDPILNYLREKRNISIHRKEIQPIAERTKPYDVDVLLGNSEDFKDQDIKKEDTTVKTATIGWFFEDERKYTIDYLCQYYYEKLKVFLQDIRKIYPLSR